MSAAADTSQKALPIKRQRFARQFAMHGNRTRAAKEAGYSEKTAYSIGHELLKFPEVQQAIEHERRQILAERGITPNGVLSMIADIAKFDINEVFDENGRIREISEMSDVARRVVAGIDTFTVTAKGGESFSTTSKIKLPDRLRALELLAKHFSLLSDNVTIKGDAESPFVAIIRKAQGSALMPIAQRDDGDTANELESDANVIDGEVIEKEDAPASDIASVNPLEAFHDIDDGEDETDAEQDVADVTPVDEPPPEDEAIKRRDDFVLWRGRRRRNV